MPLPPASAVLLDTNVLVAAIKHPTRQTATYRLVVRLLGRPDLRLVGDEVLAEEYLRYAEVFPSSTGKALLSALLNRMEIVHIEDRFLAACAPYFAAEETADRLHAAACLQLGAVLVSNDRHFEPARKAGLISVCSVTDAVRTW
ncbi:MAG: PIN domain-containing protein [Candidatus Thermoplasmatota archaeon]